MDRRTALLGLAACGLTLCAAKPPWAGPKPRPTPSPTPTPTLVPTPTPAPTPAPWPQPPSGALDIRDGRGIEKWGVATFTNTPSVIRSLDIRNYQHYGILDQDAQPIRTPTGISTVEDVVVSGIRATTEIPPPGTAEHGFQFGNPVMARRLVAHDIAWAAFLLLAECHGSTLEHFRAFNSKVGVYVEHNAHHNIIQYGDVAGWDTSINSEWWYNGHGPHSNTYRYLRVYCPPTPTGPGGAKGGGIFIDAGGYGNEFSHIVFEGPGDALGLPSNLADPSQPNRYDLSTLVFNNLGRKVWFHDNLIG